MSGQQLNKQKSVHVTYSSTSMRCHLGARAESASSCRASSRPGLDPKSLSMATFAVVRWAVPENQRLDHIVAAADRIVSG